MKKKFITLFVSAFAVMLGMGIVTPLMPLYAQSMGATGIWLGIIFSSFALASLIFTPLMGKISDKRGRKKFISVGLFFYTVLSLGYVFASDIYSLTWVRFLHGFASAMVLPLVMAYVGDIAPRGKEGQFMGYFNVSIFIGMGFGPFIGGILTDSFGMVSVFYAMCTLSAFALIFTSVFLTEETSYIIKKSEKQHKKYASFRRILGNDIVKGLLTYRFISSIGNGALMAFLPVLAISFGITITQIGIIVGINVFLMALLQIPFGRFADKYSKRSLILISGISSAVILSMIPFSSNFETLLSIIVLLGIAWAVGMPAATAINTKVGREYGMGTAMSMFSTAMSAGMVISPLLAGIIMDFIGIKFIFYLSGFATIIGTVLFYLFTKNYNRKIK